MDYGSIASLLIGFSLVVIVHELGHFLAAKYVGIRVEQFALGFGQALFAWRKGIGFRIGSTEKEYTRRVAERAAQKVRAESEAEGKTEPNAAQLNSAAAELGLGETEYRFNWVPLGGYVKMMGQDDTKPGMVVNDPRSYTNKTVGQRMLVISAGVIMNIVFAFVAFMIVFMWGLKVPVAEVGTVLPLSPAQLAVRADGTPAPLQPGDRILRINGEWQYDSTKVRLNTALAQAGEPMKIEIERTDKRTETVSVVPERATAGGVSLLGIGIGPARLLEGPDLDWKKLKDEYDKLPASARPIKPREVITQVEGRDVKPTEYYVLDQAMQKSDGKPVPVTVKGVDGTLRQVAIQPELLAPFQGDLSFAGMIPRAAVAGLTDKSAVTGKLFPGDVVLAISSGGDVRNDPSIDEFVARVRKAGENGQPIDLRILRDGNEVNVADLQATIRLAGGRGLGIAPTYDLDHAVVAQTEKGSAGAAIPVGSKLTAINGEAVVSWADVLTQLRKAKAGADVGVAYVDPAGTLQSQQIKLADADAKRLAAYRYHTDVVLDDHSTVRKTSSPFEAAIWGVTETRDSVLQVYITIRRLVERSVPFSGMMGPVGMFTVGTTVASRGYDYLLWFLAIISANLAVVNFLPVPVVDGGHFMFLTIEKLRGKPVSERAMVVAQYVGLAMILTLFVAVTYQDIMRLIIVQ